MRIASTIEVKCSRFSNVCRPDAQTLKFENSNMEGKVSQRKNSSWYDLNFKFSLSILASGLGPSNMSELFSF